MKWQRRGVCSNDETVNPDWFVIDEDSDVNPDVVAEMHRKAKMACQRCPVLAECRAWVLSSEHSVGVIVAGMTSDEVQEHKIAAKTDQAPHSKVRTNDSVSAEIMRKTGEASWISREILFAEIRAERARLGKRTVIPRDIVLQAIAQHVAPSEIAKQLGCDVRSVVRIKTQAKS